MMDRRAFLRFSLAAPFIVRASSLMRLPVTPLSRWERGTVVRRLDYITGNEVVEWSLQECGRQYGIGFLITRGLADKEAQYNAMLPHLRLAVEQMPA